MVVGDEAVLGVMDTFVAQQAAGEEAAEDLQNNIFCEASQCVPVVRGRLHLEDPTIVIV